MAITLDMSKDSESREFVTPGRALCEVVDFEEFATKNGSHILKLEVLDHDKNENIGRIHWEYYSSADAAVFRLRHLAVVTGIVSIEDVERARKNNEFLELEFKDAIGKKVFVLFEEDEYEGKIRVVIGNSGTSIYSIDDPKVKKMFDGIGGKIAAIGNTPTPNVSPDDIRF